MRRLLKPLWILLALVFLFEAWLWEHLPPYPTLLIFLIPVILLFPLKLLGLWMLAHGSWLGAMAVLALAKIVSMGVMAFIFEVTRPKLMQLGWFRWIYEHVMMGLAW